MAGPGLPLGPALAAGAVEMVACPQGPEEIRDLQGSQRKKWEQGWERWGMARGESGSQRGMGMVGEDTGFSALQMQMRFDANEFQMKQS